HPVPAAGPPEPGGLPQPWNRMTHQNLAVCFGPVLLTPTQELWPVPTNRSPEQEVVSRRGRDARLESPPPINRYAGDWSVCGRDFLSGQEADYDEVAGKRQRRSSDEEEQKKRCSSDEEEQKKRCSSDEEEQKKGSWSSAAAGPGLYVEEFLDFDAPFNCRLSLKDFDTLIHDLERELIHICL
ncbi:hypothetical protein KUCAC02_032603, partial [Chaenocephalus aceratus]